MHPRIGSASSNAAKKQTDSASLLDSHGRSFRVTVEPGAVCRFDIQPTNSRHRHDYFEIVIITGGQGEYQLEDRVFKLERGDLFVSPPGQIHEIRSFETRDLELFFVSFNAVEIPISIAVSELDRAFQEFVDQFEPYRARQDRLLPYVDLYHASPSEATRDALIRLFTTEALQALSYASGDRNREVAYPQEIQLAIKYIESNCTRSVSAEEVAAHVNLSARTLRRRFSLHVGQGVAEEIRRRRMRIAAHQLLMGYSVQEVAERIGMPDVSQFARTFRMEMKKTPKKFQSSYSPGSLSRRTIFGASDDIEH